MNFSKLRKNTHTGQKINTSLTGASNEIRDAIDKFILLQKPFKTLDCDDLFGSNGSSSNPTPKIQNIGPKEGKRQYSDGSFSKKSSNISLVDLFHLKAYWKNFKGNIVANPPAGVRGVMVT